jgi:hypothetical protein
VLYSATDVSLATGMKGLNYAVYGVSNTLNRQIDHKSKIGVGVTVEFNGSQNSQIIVEGGSFDEVDLPFDRHLAMSIFPSYELVMTSFQL